MKDAYEVLKQKEADVDRVRREIESLKVVASLLADANSDEPGETDSIRTEKKDHHASLEPTGSDGLSSVPTPPSGIWSVLKRK
jgi:hypothetical protein